MLAYAVCLSPCGAGMSETRSECCLTPEETERPWGEARAHTAHPSHTPITITLPAPCGTAAVLGRAPIPYTHV